MNENMIILNTWKLKTDKNGKKFYQTKACAFPKRISDENKEEFAFIVDMLYSCRIYFSTLDKVEKLVKKDSLSEKEEISYKEFNSMINAIEEKFKALEINPKEFNREYYDIEFKTLLDSVDNTGKEVEWFMYSLARDIIINVEERSNNNDNYKVLKDSLSSLYNERFGSKIKFNNKYVNYLLQFSSKGMKNNKGYIDSRFTLRDFSTAVNHMFYSFLTGKELKITTDKIIGTNSEIDGISIEQAMNPVYRKEYNTTTKVTKVTESI